MPPLPPVPNVGKLIIEGKYHDAHWLCIFFQSWTGANPTAGAIGSLLAEIKISTDDEWKQEMSADNEITGFEWTDLSSELGATAFLADSTFGVRAGDFMPASVAMVVSKTISRRYRGGHPRNYLPWGTAGTMASGSTIDWDSGFVADCVTKYSTWLAGVSGYTFGGTTFGDLVSVSYVNAGARRVTPVVDTITGYDVRTRICSQRRRLGRVGG
jgi:hypothetical protein